MCEGGLLLPFRTSSLVTRHIPPVVRSRGAAESLCPTAEPPSLQEPNKGAHLHRVLWHPWTRTDDNTVGNVIDSLGLSDWQVFNSIALPHLSTFMHALFGWGLEDAILLLLLLSSFLNHSRAATSKDRPYSSATRLGSTLAVLIHHGATDGFES
jgi:hypothetical protein